MPELPSSSEEGSFFVHSVDSTIMVSVAQLVELWIVAPVAAGSIPVAHPLDGPVGLALRELTFRRTLKLHSIQGLFSLVQLRSNRR